VEAELLFIDQKRNLLQLCVDKLKDKLMPSKQQFKEKKTENSKAFRQLLRAKSDEILKKRGVNLAAQFGGDLEGNVIQKLMAEAFSIIITNDVEEQVLGTERVVRTHEETQDMCEKCHQLFLPWDGYFSGLWTKHFLLTDEIVNRRKEFLVRSVLLERYLGMSITPKIYVMDDHSIQQ
jgi:hypothetical protein